MSCRSSVVSMFCLSILWHRPLTAVNVMEYSETVVSVLVTLLIVKLFWVIFAF